MTQQQKIYFDAIRAFIQAKGYSPSLAQVAKLVGVKSIASVHRMVHTLLEEGVLVRDISKQTHNLHVVPDKLDGFNRCDRGHVLIFFQESVCPLCTEIQRRVPARVVRFAS